MIKKQNSYLKPSHIAGLCLTLIWSSLPTTNANAQALQGNEYGCLIEALQRVEVGAAVSGVITNIHVDRGDLVKKGQLLFELQSEVERARYQIARENAQNDFPLKAAKAQYGLSVTNTERLETLRKKNKSAVNDAQLSEALAQRDIARSNLGNATMELRAAKLQADSAKANLDERSVRSPIDGVVLKKSMSSGEYRHEQAVVLTLVALDPLNVETYLPKAVFGQVTKGQTAKIAIEAPIDATKEATVSIVDPIVDAASGTFGVRLSLPNEGYAIPAGLRCSVVFW